MRKSIRVKIATAALTGLFVTLGLVWQAEAFFSRDQWFSPAPPSNGGAASQAVTNSAPPATIGTGGGGGAATSGAGSITGPTGGQQPTVANPEPSTVLLLASGLVGLGLWRRSQKNV